jgi:DNA (cytosine-5)-methyltransferase 1
MNSNGRWHRRVIVDASTGYVRAGFDVVGWDIIAQPDYPFEFEQGDALELLDELIGNGGHLPDGRPVVAVHASPPCQAAAAPTLGTNAKRNADQGRAHPQLIPDTRERLDRLGLPYVIENAITTVKLGLMRADVVLCGLPFGLRVFRHRAFELDGHRATAPPHPRGLHTGHRVRGYRHGVNHPEGDMLAVYGDGGGKATTAECREGLGIDWSWDRDQLIEAIPPAYTEWLGGQLMAALDTPAVAIPR